MGIISWAIILIAGQSVFDYVERQLSAVIYKYLELFFNGIQCNSIYGVIWPVYF